MTLRVPTSVLAVVIALSASGYAQEASPLAELAGEWKLGDIRPLADRKGKEAYQLPIEPAAKLSIRRHGTVKGFVWLPINDQNWTAFDLSNLPPVESDGETVYLKLKAGMSTDKWKVALGQDKTTLVLSHTGKKPRRDVVLTRDEAREAEHAKSHEALAKKMQKTLGMKADGYFLFALEQRGGNMPASVKIEVRSSQEAAADAMAGFMEDAEARSFSTLVHAGPRLYFLELAPADKAPKRTCKLIARLEPNDEGKMLAETHQRQLQTTIQKRFKAKQFTAQVSSEAGVVAGKTVEQKIADGNLVRYTPFR